MNKITIDELIKINMGIEYNIFEDCNDKIIIFKIPTHYNINYAAIFNAIKKESKRLKEICGAKEILIIPEYIGIDIGNKEDAIKYIDNLINKLNNDKIAIENVLKEGD